MRKLALFLMLTNFFAPAFAAKRVTVKQLDLALNESKGRSDKELAQWLRSLELTERLNTQKLQRWKDAMPGTESSQALTALTDASSFLNPPTEEIPHTAPLDKNAQQQLISAASAYVDKTLSRLPNFFATEVITLFEDTPAQHDGSDAAAYKPMHYENQMKATVLYRERKEVMETRAGEITEKDQLVSSESGLLSSGEFGPVLGTVLAGAQKGKLSWSHWDSGKTTIDQIAPGAVSLSPTSDPAELRFAVFRYSVPRKESHYKVKVEVAGESKPRQTRPGYHGEITIDPANGTIVRLTLRADMTDDDPVLKADMMVEYGRVQIGGMSYICPTRSVAIVVADQQLQKLSSTGQVLRGGGTPQMMSGQQARRESGSTQTLLNDVAFEHYHLLRSETRMLTGADLNDGASTP